MNELLDDNEYKKWLIELKSKSNKVKSKRRWQSIAN